MAITQEVGNLTLLQRLEQKEHVGPMAQDFKAAFGLGDSDKEIQAVDAFGVLLMAVKALSEEVEQLKRERG